MRLDYGRRWLCVAGTAMLVLACGDDGASGEGTDGGPAARDAGTQREDGGTHDGGSSGEDDGGAGGDPDGGPCVPGSAGDDSDADGLTDGEEAALSTDACDPDSDGDGAGDLVEHAFERVRCSDPSAPGAFGCGCATDAACQPGPEVTVVLPRGAPPIVEEVELDTTIRAVDVLLLIDTSDSMDTTLEGLSAGFDDLVTDVDAALDDVRFGAAQHDDFPLCDSTCYGGDESTVLSLASPLVETADAADVQTALDAMAVREGGDVPQAHTEALYQSLTGEGETWESDDAEYVLSIDDCADDDAFGAPCFLPRRLPVVVLFTDACAHMAPAGESTACAAYTGLTPTPHSWTQLLLETNRRGAKLVGVNASDGGDCGSATPDGTSPCYFLVNTAEATSSLDLNRDPIVVDAPGATTSTADLVKAVGDAIVRTATRVPMDVSTAPRDDDSDGVDARDFFRERRPACTWNRVVDPTLPAPPCWDPPAGLTREEAVAFIDGTAFRDLVPGSRARFDVTFQNLTVTAGSTTRVFLAHLDARLDGVPLATRDVIIVVPAGCLAGSGDPAC